MFKRQQVHFFTHYKTNDKICHNLSTSIVKHEDLIVQQPDCRTLVGLLFSSVSPD